MAVNQAPVGNPRQVALQVSFPDAHQAAQDISALRQVFQNIQADSCPHTYNFHMHTVYSDGQLQPESLIEQACRLGLRGLAITDHHTVKGYKLAQQWLIDRSPETSLEHPQENSPENPPDNPSNNTKLTLPHLWTGVEITSHLIGTEVHILGYGFNPDHQKILPYLQGTAPQEEQAHAAQVIRAIQQAGGLAILAHPARYRQPTEQVVTAAVQLGIDGVETYYAYNNPNPWQTSPDQSQQIKSLSKLYNLLNTCGTDTHGLDLLRRI
ncbi:MAG: PHP domain-containing protein [Coleofasciculaceae cyanobacterium SM2_1_6]|nr:PHP domain-containing protein [Coleofasciculaceae cyanobacterium SM2_1_6]